MKRRGGLFFIGLVSAILTIISLNIAFGRQGYYFDRYPYYNRYHHCDDRYDRNHDERSKQDRDRRSDSTNNNY
jgi:hypothetical protein